MTIGRTNWRRPAAESADEGKGELELSSGAGDCDPGAGGGKESGGFGAGGRGGADDTVSLAEARSDVHGGVQHLAARDAGDGQGAIGGIDGWGGDDGGGGDEQRRCEDGAGGAEVVGVDEAGGGGSDGFGGGGVEHVAGADEEGEPNAGCGVSSDGGEARGWGECRLPIAHWRFFPCVWLAKAPYRACDFR